MADYASNSDRKLQEEQEAQKPRATGAVQGRKAAEAEPKKGFGKFLDRIVRSETGESLEGYFMRSIADMLCHGVGVIGDLISDTISLRLTDKPARSRSNSVGSRVSYRKYYEDEEEDDEYDYRKRKRRTAGVENYADIIFDSRGDAEIALERMYEVLERFEVVSVADLYDIAQIKHDYQTNKYGWMELDGAHVERTRDGFVLALPKATSI